jgi:glycine/D-amino acid oxidase-like deaminating enzyme
MGQSCDVAIAGAGIVGAACAMECAAAGLRVVVVEPGPIGGGATAAGMGHIVVMDDSPAQMALTYYSRTLWRELAAELPPEVEYVEAGTIWVAADSDEMAEVHRKKRVCDGIGVRTEVLDSQALAEAEPNLRRNLAGGLLVPEDAVIYPPCAALHFMDTARRLGTILRAGETAVALSGQGLSLRDGTLLSAGITVDATGAWAAGVRKRKGHLVITDRYPGFVRHQLAELGYLKSAHSTTEDSVAFNVQPRRTGQVLIGSSRQFGAEDSAIDTPILARMLARAREYMPGIADLLAIRSWTGFRAATRDKLPLIGPSAHDPRLYLATGHEGLGITTSLATAKLVVDRILGRPSAIPCEPYLPGREREAQS